MGKDYLLAMNDPEIINREKVIQADGSKVTQNYRGNCGLAGVVMAMMNNLNEPVIKAKYEALKKTVYENQTPFENIKNSEKIRKRIERRYKSGYANTPDHNLDYDLCTGLMILLKESLRNQGVEGREMWDANVLYSSLLCDFIPTTWSSNPLKTKAVINQQVTAGMNSKHGDMALTVTTSIKLFELMGFKAQEVLLKDNINQVKENHEKSKLNTSNQWNTPNTATFFQQANRTFPYGALVGVASMIALGKPAAALYDYVVHWVYLPKSTHLTQIQDPEFWNWGDTPKLSQLQANSTHQFIPVKCLELSLP